MKIRLANDVQFDSIVDGPGLRAVVWAQGCKHNCQGCHNPQTHDMNGGFEADTLDVIEKLASMKLQKGVTLSGGDPFFQPEAMTEIAYAARFLGLDVWAYTGFTFEQLVSQNDPASKARMELLKLADVLVDGRFEIAKRDTTLFFRGSSNQRLIDVQRTLEKRQQIEDAEPVIYEPLLFMEEVIEKRREVKLYPLHFAVERHDAGLLKFFLNHGADVTQKDEHGRTALEIAEEQEIIAILTDAETNPREVGKDEAYRFIDEVDRNVLPEQFEVLIPEPMKIYEGTVETIQSRGDLPEQDAKIAVLRLDYDGSLWGFRVSTLDKLPELGAKVQISTSKDGKHAYVKEANSRGNSLAD